MLGSESWIAPFSAVVRYHVEKKLSIVSGFLFFSLVISIIFVIYAFYKKQRCNFHYQYAVDFRKDTQAWR